MTAPEDVDLKDWTADWQAAPPAEDSSERIRRYVARRGGLLRSFAIADFVVAGLALPVLAYLGWTTTSNVERLAMFSLSVITIGAVTLGWWNRRGVTLASATSISEFVSISEERLRRMRIACRLGWLVLAAQVVVFTVWVSDRLYSTGQAPDPDAQRFAWSWLAGMTAAAAIGLVLFGRWLNRDADRFSALRGELMRDYTPESTMTGDSARTRSVGARATRKPRRPPLT